MIVLATTGTPVTGASPAVGNVHFFVVPYYWTNSTNYFIYNTLYGTAGAKSQEIVNFIRNANSLPQIMPVLWNNAITNYGYQMKNATSGVPSYNFDFGYYLAWFDTRYTGAWGAGSTNVYVTQLNNTVNGNLATTHYRRY